MDILGQIICISVFLTPVLTIPIAWRLMDSKKIFRVFIGLFFAFALSFLLFYIALAIIFRDGMGPV